MWVPEIKRAWRMLSMQAVAVSSALWAAWLAFPEHQPAIIEAIGLDPGKWGPMVAFVAFAAARLKAQPGLRDD